jgi:two-component system response regulator RegA
MKHEPLILVVDDDPEVARVLARSLSHRGFRTETTSSPEGAVELASKTAYDAALVDLVMPGQDGVSLASELRSQIPGLPVAILTGYAHSPLISAAHRAGVSVFRKPTPIQDLVEYLNSQIPKRLRGQEGGETG